VIERTTGRIFVYNNNNKILVYSHKPERVSDTDDKSKPLIEMNLMDTLPCRRDPTLYILEEEDYSVLLVIGGYRMMRGEK
jgi:hypothetical protein